MLGLWLGGGLEFRAPEPRRGECSKRFLEPCSGEDDCCFTSEAGGVFVKVLRDGGGGRLGGRLLWGGGRRLR